MRDRAAAEEKRVENALKEARALLRPLTARGPSGAIIAWHDSNASRDPRDEYQGAVAFVDALLGDDKDEAANSFLGVHASLVRSVILPALRCGRPPQKQGRRVGHLWDRWIAAVVATICRRYGFDPTRSPGSYHPCGCSIIAKALGQLGIPKKMTTVAGIWTKYGREVPRVPCPMEQ
jgi:hypothetical protein